MTDTHNDAAAATVRRQQGRELALKASWGAGGVVLATYTTTGSKARQSRPNKMLRWDAVLNKTTIPVGYIFYKNMSNEIFMKKFKSKHTWQISMISKIFYEYKNNNSLDI